MRRLVAQARVARLATVGSDRAPHLVPLCFILDGDRVYWAVDRKPKETTQLRRLRNIRANPRVSILVDHYEEDWSALYWIRLDGRSEVVEDKAEIGSALELLRDKYAQYRDQPPEGPVVRTEIEHWSAWRGGRL